MIGCVSFQHKACPFPRAAPATMSNDRDPDPQPFSPRRLVVLNLYGAVAGLLAGAVVLAFRWAIEVSQIRLLPTHRIGDYEGLPPALRLLIPLGGALLLGLAFERLAPATRQVGLVHVLSYLRATRTGHLPLRNALTQFLAGVVAVGSGQSVDREGPGVHLGAACGSLIAQWRAMAWEDNYTLMACGAAAAIAAAFNTPLAGALFVIEVFRVQYLITRFMPVITASVIGAVLSRAVYGHATAFSIPPLSMSSLAELPMLAGLGLFTGLLSVVFVRLTRGIARHSRDWRPALAFPLAGLGTGVAALWAPQILGISYDTLDAMLHGKLGWQALALILSLKLAATAWSIGLRLPGGLIGPSLVIGGAAGTLVGLVTVAWYPFPSGSSGFYAIIGMLAMMSAVLQAPLAALTALLELTGNSTIILPGMVAIITADLVSRQWLGQESIIATLSRLGERPVEPPVTPPGEDTARPPDQTPSISRTSAGPR